MVRYIQAKILWNWQIFITKCTVVKKENNFYLYDIKALQIVIIQILITLFLFQFFIPIVFEIVAQLPYLIANESWWEIKTKE